MAASTTASPLGRGARITGAERERIAAQLAERYGRGESIRSMAADLGRSYGWVQGLLKEAGVTLRGRGGATRGAAGAERARIARGEATPEESPKAGNKKPAPVVEEAVSAQPEKAKEPAKIEKAKKPAKTKPEKAPKIEKVKADKAPKTEKAKGDKPAKIEKAKGDKPAKIEKAKADKPAKIKAEKATKVEKAAPVEVPAEKPKKQKKDKKSKKKNK